MKNITSLFAALLAILGICVQAMISWAWIKMDTTQQFLNVFSSLYGHIPTWSRLAFSTRDFSWAFPLVCAVLLSYTFAAKRSRAFLFGVAALSLLIAGGLIYAMYPIHLMLRVPI
jgi:small neutral amino acid transporter SnatA (MarC family)